MKRIGFILVQICYFITVLSGIPDILILDTLYGRYEITEPVLIEIIEHPMMQRLKKVRQFGMNYYLKPLEYDRYTHSIGVMVLVRRYGGGVKEQAAAVLHDISHGPFSHMMDVYRKVDITKDAYQDTIHEIFLAECGMGEVLERYGFTVHDLVHKNEEFSRLESALPDICADRLEYNLYEGYLEGLITKEEIGYLLQDLQFEGNTWYFTRPEYARRIGELSLYFTQTHWTSPATMIMNRWGSDALHRAMTLGIINEYDVSYGTDEDIWMRLHKSGDQEIAELLYKILHYDEYFVLDTDEYDMIIRGKCRGIDPVLFINNRFMRLSEFNREFAQEFERVKTMMADGWHIRLKANQ